MTITSPVDEYLFDRRSLFGGFPIIQTSSYLLPHQLFDKVRFDEECPHDDWGFLLHLSKRIGAKIETVPEALVVLHFEEQRPSTPVERRRGRVLSNGSTA